MINLYTNKFLKFHKLSTNLESSQLFLNYCKIPYKTFQNNLLITQDKPIHSDLIYELSKYNLKKNKFEFSTFESKPSKRLKKSFDNLEKDIHYTSDRYRRFSLIDIENMLSLGDGIFFQSSNYNNNSSLSDKPRKYNLIDDHTVLELKDFIYTFRDQIHSLNNIKIKYAFLHQIRVCPFVNEFISPTPEGIHQDGYHYIGIYCSSRFNVIGGETEIYSENKLKSKKILKEGEFAILNDKEVFHFTGDLSKKKNDKISYRDIFVITTIV